MVYVVKTVVDFFDCGYGSVGFGGQSVGFWRRSSSR
ncbi:unnamed protein product [Brassica oleracea var. botrytis]